MLLRQCVEICQHTAQSMGAAAHDSTIRHIGPLHSLRNPLGQNGSIYLGLEPVLHPAPETTRFSALGREQWQDTVFRIRLFQKFDDGMGMVGHDSAVLALIDQHGSNGVGIKARHLFRWFPGRRHDKFDLELFLSEDEPNEPAGRV